MRDGLSTHLRCFEQNLTPKELQQAMTQAFTKVEKKGRLRSLYTTGKFLYTAGSWGATALS